MDICDVILLYILIRTISEMEQPPTVQAIFSAEDEDVNLPEVPAPETEEEAMEIDEEPIRRPPRFLGDRKLVESYISHCLTNFNSYPARFPDEGRKVLYLLNNMGGYAYEWASKLLSRYPVYSHNSTEFINRIRNTFGDPDLEYHHQRQFRALRQHGIGNALDYVNEFRRLAIFVNTEENLLMDNFHQGLDPRLQERLDNIFPQPDNLDDLARLAVRLDRHMLQQINRRNRNQRTGQGQPNNRRNNDTNYSRENRHTNPSNNQARNNSPTIRCSYCSRIGHTEDNCYRRQNDIRRQQNNNSTNASTISQNPVDKQKSGPMTTFTISPGKTGITLECLIDTGAFACFLDKKFADSHSIHYLPDPEVKFVHGINGSSNVYGLTDYMPIKYQQYSSTIQFYIIDLKNYSGIIGYNWLKDNNLTINFDNKGKLNLNFDNKGKLISH